jgi:Tol biopolymer transport system component
VTRRWIAFAVAASLVACIGPSPPTASPSARSAVGLVATFVLANPAGLVGLDASGQMLGPIVQLPAQSAPSSPALDPTGKTLVFALVPQADPVRGFGADIMAVGIDGTGLRSIILHEKDNVFYSQPRFDRTGKAVLYHRTEAVIQTGSYLGNLETIERIDLATGERQRLLTDAADFTLTPAGDAIVFTHLDQGLPDALWRANIDGTDPRPFLTTNDRWFYLQSPRAGPTGCDIAFSAAGHTTSRIAPRDAVVGQAHLGYPSDLVIAPCDGSSIRVVTRTVDDVEPAWSPSGAEIAYTGSGGLFVVTVASGTVRTIATGQTFFFGSLIWLR